VSRVAGETSRPECFVVAGPTACGKTELALALAERFPLEIVSMDSAMVYRGMDIGTAKPAPALRRRVAHHLIDVRDPVEVYSAGEFCADAARAIADIRARGRVPLVVGGTMLYLRALREGLAPLPRAEPALRAEIDAEAARIGWPAMHARLMAIDPATAARLAPGDRQRVQRALEIHALTGRPLSELQRSNVGQPVVSMYRMALMPPDRAELAQRIAARFDAMIEAGFIAEVRALMARGDLSAAAPAMRAVGYRQIWAHLAGSIDWAEARGAAIAATRQLAKRQLTWLRSDRADLVLGAFDTHAVARLSPLLEDWLRSRA
jgi:tRNA dimethylallyltransferase